MANDDDEVTVSKVDQYLRQPLIAFHRSNSFSYMVKGKQTSLYTIITTK